MCAPVSDFEKHVNIDRLIVLHGLVKGWGVGKKDLHWATFLVRGDCSSAVEGTNGWYAITLGTREHFLLTSESIGIIVSNLLELDRIQPKEEKDMADLVAVTFDNETTAFELRAELAKLQKEYLIAMEDVVVVSRDAEEKVKPHQAVNLTAVGAAGVGFRGMLIGFIFLNPILGAAIGAGAGALSGYLTNLGFDNTFMKELGESLPKEARPCLLL